MIKQVVVVGALAWFSGVASQGDVKTELGKLAGTWVVTAAGGQARASRRPCRAGHHRRQIPGRQRRDGRRTRGNYQTQFQRHAGVVRPSDRRGHRRGLDATRAVRGEGRHADAHPRRARRGDATGSRLQGQADARPDDAASKGSRRRLGGDTRCERQAAAIDPEAHERRRRVGVRYARQRRSGGSAIPFAAVVVTGSHVRLIALAARATYDGDLKGGELIGTWRQGRSSAPLVFKRAK